MPNGEPRPPKVPPPLDSDQVDTPIVTDEDLAKDSRSIEGLNREIAHLHEIIAAKRRVGEDEGGHDQGDGE